MSLLTRSELDAVVDLPLGLPLAEILGGDWLVISVFALESQPAVKATMQVLQIGLFTIGQGYAVSDQSAGLCFVGIYKLRDRFGNLLYDPTVTSPVSAVPIDRLIIASPQTSQLCSTETLPLVVSRTGDALILDAGTDVGAAGDYGVLVMNNTDKAIQLTVEGGIRLDFAAL